MIITAREARSGRRRRERQPRNEAKKACQASRQQSACPPPESGPLSLMSVYKQGDRERDPPKQEKKKDFFDEVGEEFDKLGNKFAKMQPPLVEKRAGEG